MVKKLLCALLMLGMALTCSGALAEQPAVADELNLFNQSDRLAIEERIDTLRTKYQVDAVVLTTMDTPSTDNDSRLVDYADRYYEDHGYGCGTDRAGIIYMIDLNNRYSYLSTAGVMIDYLSDSRIESCLDDAQPYLKSGKYGKAAIALLDRVLVYMERGIEGGSFRYDEVTGERLSGLYNTLTAGELSIAAAAGAAVAGLILLITSAAYKLRGKTYRYDLEKNAAINLTRDDETFVRQVVTRTRNDSGSGGHGGHGGSGVHHSSGGMIHGGGGRHF